MEPLPIINLTYEVYKFIFNMNLNLDKKFRYTLGQQIELNILDLISNLITAKNAPKTIKGSLLIKAQTNLEIITLKIRLMLELNIVNNTKIFQAQSKLSETGRMLGGWLKSLQS
ncbi:MAG TPA: four helix bundle protein [Candidatus Gracilibacteria bacterium]|nr:four helix bundle protein [Candidatus Gracilibacteria bacterium]